MKSTSLAVTTRPLEPTDLAAVVDIDEKIAGQGRPRYWQTRMDIAALRPPWMSLVAESDDRVVGFLFGWVGESEFGIATPTAWIDLIAVAPPYRAHGVAHVLVERFAASAREFRGIARIATLIDLAQPEIREFFGREGFRPGPMVQWERPA